MKKIPVVTAVLAGAVLVYFLASGVHQGESVPEKPMPAPELSAPRLGGGTLSLKDYAGKAVLVDFWATWCDPCRAEVPELIKLNARLKDKGVAVLGFSMDEDVKDVPSFVKEFKVDYPVGLIGSERAPKGWVVPGLPTAYVIGKDGMILKRYFGPQPTEVFERDLEAALAR